MVQPKEAESLRDLSQFFLHQIHVHLLICHFVIIRYLLFIISSCLNHRVFKTFYYIHRHILTYLVKTQDEIQTEIIESLMTKTNSKSFIIFVYYLMLSCLVFLYIRYPRFLLYNVDVVNDQSTQ